MFCYTKILAIIIVSYDSEAFSSVVVVHSCSSSASQSTLKRTCSLPLIEKRACTKERVKSHLNEGSKISIEAIECVRLIRENCYILSAGRLIILGIM